MDIYLYISPLLPICLLLSSPPFFYLSPLSLSLSLSFLTSSSTSYPGNCAWRNLSSLSDHSPSQDGASKQEEDKKTSKLPLSLHMKWQWAWALCVWCVCELGICVLPFAFVALIRWW